MDNKDTLNYLEQVRTIPLASFMISLNMDLVDRNDQQARFYLPSIHSSNHLLKVDLLRNTFYDSITKTHGGIIEFGKAYFNWDVPELLTNIRERHTINPKEAIHPSEIAEIEDHPTLKGVRAGIADPALVDYLEKIRIPKDLYNKHCREIDFIHYGEPFTGIGFLNDQLGYDVIHPNGKVQIGPAGHKFVNNGGDKIDVFNQFSDYLNQIKLRPSALNIEILAGERIHHQLPPYRHPQNALILSNLSSFEAARPILEKHKQVNLYLDNSKLGNEIKGYAQWLDDKKYQDFSKFFKNHLTYTDMCISKAKSIREGQKLGM